MARIMLTELRSMIADEIRMMELGDPAASDPRPGARCAVCDVPFSKHELGALRATKAHKFVAKKRVSVKD